MTNENDNENKIMTAEYCWKVNREDLYRDLSQQVNEKLNQAVQELRYSISDPAVLSFPSDAITKHFANELESHGWLVTMCCLDDDVIQIDIAGSIDQADKDMKVINQAHYFSQDDLDNLN
ncbi:hypothetical protein [Schleiferilactobacillus harbinensis]|uniref:hypothetical protein n=1 Tax=Schleiferilactobacillus harbinensis TaxID=304207 RepID=UPI0039E945D8